MKNYLLIFIYTVCVVFTGLSQKGDTTIKNYSTVYLPKYYKEKGVIFNKDYVVGIDMRDFKSRYTPTIDDITKAEEIFNKQYDEVQKTNIDTKVFFCHWVRQYVGLVDSSGNKNIIVQLINNNKPGKINRMLGKDWESVFIIMLADEFYAVSTRFRINIDTHTMTTKL
jgi:hypothetical protein